MQDNEKKPALRFKGFTDPWEQRKLGEVFEEYSEKNHAELPPLTIIQGGGTIRRDESERALQYDKSSLSNYKMVNKDDFIVHLRSFEGGLEKASSQGIISPAYHTFHGEDVDSRFYYAYFRSKNFINKDLKPHVYGIRDGRSIDIEGMKTIRIPWASYPEQKSIGDFLTHLDTLITLHQRKYEKLVNIKKSMLDKMFPQNGASVPEIRFKGFTDPWEQRKLGDAFERVVRKNTNNESRLPLTISAQDGLVDQITYFNNRVASRDVSNYYLVYNGEFAYNKSTSDGYPFGAVKRLDWYEKGVLSTLYIVFALKHPEKDDSDFMTVFYDTDRWHRGVAERAAEGARNHGLLNISADDFFDIDTTMPEDKAEQEKIGRLLKKLDTLITLHQRKLEKLQNIKKSCLEKMFV